MRSCFFIFFFMTFCAFCIAQDVKTNKMVDDSLRTSATQTVEGDGKPIARVTTPTVIGDVNGDNIVNAIDVVDIIKYVKGAPRSVFNATAADINGDGKVDEADAHSLSVYIIGGAIPITSGDVIQGSSIEDPSF